MSHPDKPDWIKDETVIAVISALGESRFVGGCVRDWLLGRPVKDLDIATPLLPDEVISRCTAAGIKTVPTGIDHGTVTAVMNGRGFEITSLRKDVETDGRRAVVNFSADWAEDAARRDFTINALYADKDGAVFDPLEQGLADIKQKHLRFVGMPAQRIEEDYLRILRYFRFAAQLGWALDDKAALAACRNHADKIGGLSKERITQEMLKLLAADNPAPALRLMADNHILPKLFEGLDWEAFERLCVYTHNMLTRLSMLSGVNQWFVLSNTHKDFLKTLSAISLSEETTAALKRLIYYQGNDRVREIYVLQCAKNNHAPQNDLLDIVNTWQAPVFPLSGDDLIKQGLSPGPALGAKLKELEAEWLDQVCA